MSWFVWASMGTVCRTRNTTASRCFLGTSSANLKTCDFCLGCWIRNSYAIAGVQVGIQSRPCWKCLYSQCNVCLLGCIRLRGTTKHLFMYHLIAFGLNLQGSQSRKGRHCFRSGGIGLGLNKYSNSHPGRMSQFVGIAQPARRGVANMTSGSVAKQPLGGSTGMRKVSFGRSFARWVLLLQSFSACRQFQLTGSASMFCMLSIWVLPRIALGMSCMR